MINCATDCIHLDIRENTIWRLPLGTSQLHLLFEFIVMCSNNTDSNTSMWLLASQQAWSAVSSGHAIVF